ncbi:hypothetical protein C8R46DRAFT_999281 [Mycena filopes]|nr:hypothetical protein C8R46DRAFT_999281 [Mycena filopes]
MPLTHNKYPVLTLPPEIVSEIFASFLPSYPEIPPQFGLLSPLFLCQICRRWRAIAISTPDLWRAIPLGVSDVSSQEKLNADAQLEIADTWLARSATRPLSIRLISSIPDSHDNSHDNPVSGILLGKILIHRHRWEYLHLVVPFDLLALVEGSMPLLRALTIGPDAFNYPLSNVLTPFHRAPKLRSALLTETFLVKGLTLPWAQLTRLESRCLYMYECASILEAAPELVYCQFTVCDADGIEPALPAAIVHSRLRNLLLSTHKSDPDVDLGELLGRFTLPALITLQVFEPAITMEVLRRFKLRSRCALQQLVVMGSSPSKGLHVYRKTFPSIPDIILA